MPDDGVMVIISCDGDVVMARQRGRELAMSVGFKGSDLTIIATAISEIARNIVSYAGRGEMFLDAMSEGSRRGVSTEKTTRGPSTISGIAWMVLRRKNKS